MAAVTTVIHNGVSLGPHRDYSTITSRPLRFVYLGRIVPWKGCDRLVKIFARLHARYGLSAGTLDLIGDTLYWDTAYRLELLSIIDKKGMGSVCRLLPHADNPIETLCRYDVFCIASKKEPD